MSQVNLADDGDQFNSIQVTTSELLQLCGDPEYGLTGEPLAVLASVFEALCQDVIVMSQCGDDTPDEVLPAIRRRARQAKAALPLLVKALSRR
jgi:hypothetical protein